MRGQLEVMAQKEEAAGGKHIRPIVLFQAQPRTADDNTTFEKILRNQLPFLPAAEALDSEAELKDLGLDSMGMVALLSDLESSYGVRFTDDALDASTFATPGTRRSTVRSASA